MQFTTFILQSCDNVFNLYSQRIFAAIVHASNVPQWDSIATLTTVSVISGFRRDADEFCALLGYNAAWSGNPLRRITTRRCVIPQKSADLTTVIAM
jgi:hypothetical protein